MLKSSNLHQASAKAAGVRSSASRARVVRCRAEEGQKAIAKVDRSKDQLYFTSDSTLQYLDGTLPGDFGFDPLGLLDPVNSGGFVNPQWLQYSEVIHCRWAMLGAAGMIAPEALAAWGVTPSVTGLPWFKTGVIPPAGTEFSYWADPYTLFFIEAVAMNFAELKRLQDYKYPGSQGKQYFIGLEAALGGSGDPAYPGGPWFNLFNLGGKSEAEMKKLKLNEIKNGRLAMLAVFGYGAQAVLTGKGPYQNLVDHLSDPVHNNIIGNFLPQ